MTFSVKLHNQLGDNILTHSVLLFLVPLIPRCYHYIDRHQRLFSLLLRLLYRPNQSQNIWSSTHIPLLRGSWNLTAVVQFHIWFIVCLPVVFAVVWIILVPSPVKPIFGVWNAFGWTILVTSRKTAVDLFELADIQYCSSSSREFLCRHSWWNRWFFRQFKCSRTMSWKCDHETLTISSVFEMYPTACICLFWVWDIFLCSS